MTELDEDWVEQQSYLARYLLDQVLAPLTGTIYLRGVLPATDAVLIVTGPAASSAASDLTAYQIPLQDDDDPVTANLALGWTRTLAARADSQPSTTVRGIPVVQVDTNTVEPAEPTEADEVVRVLRALAWPYVETPPDPALCGFLLTGPDRLRLYLAVEEAHGLIAADIRLTGALTALVTALPTLVTESERWATDMADPHCAYSIDLTDW